MDKKNDSIWFPAKTYGYGWGPPNCWQGWAVVAVFVALIIAGAVVLLSRQWMGYYLVYVMALSLCLTFVCWRKGEKPRWRWGKKD